ncbi:DUF2254 domain-containing protein [Marinomonas ostreistagni]|uniref:DUF2254 domain-containing protein n=1 Tax=Marinomonas ostreistagni TaxID=359209 RepID=UPI0019500E4E|nr:DUF2254 domain-containing protein [Marinomonas ostreistagni]MBM6552390.1 DUF2254 domain-containing protein [Marinomonas ostreistagni]
MPLPISQNNKLLKAYDIVRTSYWFVPTLIIFAVLALLALMLWVDRNSGLQEVDWLAFLYHADGEITRDLLTTIAGSVMTVVSITFSITMVALTNASSQFGPRLIRNFMNDSSTQTVLGTFIAIFLYCLALARATDDFAQGDYLPGLAFGGAMVLTLTGIFLLIYFIHHVATNLQADNIIDNVYESLQTNVQSIFEEHKHKEAAGCTREDVRQHIPEQSHIWLNSDHAGYVQAINYHTLAELMSEEKQYMELIITSGDFVTKNMAILKRSDQILTNNQRDKILSCITLGAKRTPIQDPEFAILQLVEIALRALSPSINDPYSAIACIDKLSSTLCNLTSKTFPEGIACDQNDEPRIAFKTATFTGLANTAFDQIRQHSKLNLAVQLRLLEGLIRIGEQANSEEQWQFIQQQKQLIEHDLKQQETIGNDQKETSERLNILNNLIATKA